MTNLMVKYHNVRAWQFFSIKISPICAPFLAFIWFLFWMWLYKIWTIFCYEVPFSSIFSSTLSILLFLVSIGPFMLFFALGEGSYSVQPTLGGSSKVVLVASEPVTESTGDWVAVPKNTVLVVNKGTTGLIDITRAPLHASGKNLRQEETNL